VIVKREDCNRQFVKRSEDYTHFFLFEKLNFYFCDLRTIIGKSSDSQEEASGTLLFKQRVKLTDSLIKEECAPTEA